jgi:hypothetical protein
VAELLAIYLNDHLAGAVAGSELAGRVAGSNRSDELYGLPLARVGREVREDLQSLREIMAKLDVDADRAKQLGAWLAEKLGRLKLNGRLLGYSPLSRVVELEMLRLAVVGKRSLWEVLLRIAPEEQRLAKDELQGLLARAETQLQAIEDCHEVATAEAFGAARAKRARSARK